MFFSVGGTVMIIMSSKLMEDVFLGKILYIVQ